ncbi:heavy metal translocating P-type ATPase [Rossellomorea vietnamensis]|uniref:heavy metal translocating P-type ATPase n=1 Tax=Rossellomorea vietnamensis TaxID=218284 RepID=UPI001E4B50C6|nr:heavy metal translocating P-type ATPase [Rossellomorea vietnamensis]MCC5800837.1 heavy metal translocating P-type ATPase [Rossellomorea vietnamensis]
MSQIRILHAIPGRTRLFFQCESHPRIIEANFRSVPGVYSAVYTLETRSILIHHDTSIPPRYFIETAKTRLSEPLKQEINYKKELAIGGLAFLVDVLFPARSLVGIKQLLRPGALMSVYASRHIIVNGTKGVLETKKPNADTLSTTAIFASLLKGNPRSALVILLMSTLSEIITEMTAKRTSRYVRDMMNLDVSYVWKVYAHGNEKKVSIEDISVGDEIMVFEGEKVCADGVVVSGAASIDESSITGEYFPKGINQNEKVYAGTIVKSGNIKVKVEQIGDQTAVSKIVQLIEDAQQKKAPIQSYADELSERLVPVSFLLAGIIFVTTRSWDRVLNMLVIDFVCGIKLSTAAAISASIGRAARKGALIKGGEYVQSLSAIDTVIFDKTGTLTEGKPVVKQIIPYNGYSEREILMYVASAEEHSSHPIAEAMMSLAKKWGLELPEHDHETMEQIVGHGVKARVGETDVLVGNKKLLLKEKVDTRGLKFIDKLAQKRNAVLVALNGQVAGVIVIEDEVRHGMKRTINQLRRTGVDEVVMITGDRELVAREVHQELQLDAFYSEVLPHEKAKYVKDFKQAGGNVMMVGDGINDAPALAFADVGVTMGGKRTDIAVEASDVVITSDNPMILSDVIQLSKVTMEKIHQNFTMTIAVNSVAILLGAFGVIAPIVGAAIHNAATIGVLLNSTTLLLKEERVQWKEPLPSSTTYLVDSA